MIAQIDEQQSTVIALAVDPARQAHIITRIPGSKGAAGVGAIGVHGAQIPLGFRRGRKGACTRPDVKVQAISGMWAGNSAIGAFSGWISPASAMVAATRRSWSAWSASAPTEATSRS